MSNYLERDGKTKYNDSLNKDEYKLSYGNLLVLQTIPEMLAVPKYRKILRAMVFEFITQLENKKNE